VVVFVGRFTPPSILGSPFVAVVAADFGATGGFGFVVDGAFTGFPFGGVFFVAGTALALLLSAAESFFGAGLVATMVDGLGLGLGMACLSAPFDAAAGFGSLSLGAGLMLALGVGLDAGETPVEVVGAFRGATIAVDFTGFLVGIGADIPGFFVGAAFCIPLAPCAVGFAFCICPEPAAAGVFCVNEVCLTFPGPMVAGDLTAAAFGAEPFVDLDVVEATAVEALLDSVTTVP